MFSPHILQPYSGLNFAACRDIRHCGALVTGPLVYDDHFKNLYLKELTNKLCVDVYLNTDPLVGKLISHLKQS